MAFAAAAGHSSVAVAAAGNSSVAEQHDTLAAEKNVYRGCFPLLRTEHFLGSPEMAPRQNIVRMFREGWLLLTVLEGEGGSIAFARALSKPRAVYGERLAASTWAVSV